MRLVVLILILLFPVQVLAQATQQPVEISAAGSLEWDRRAKTYVARKEALARQGAFEVRAATITAHYSDATDIQKLTAAGGVTILSPPYQATGDDALYDIARDYALLTGQDLRVTTQTDLLTARDKMEFFGKEGKMTATGQAVARRGTDQLRADVLNGFFTTDAQGNRSLTRITAEGNVVIETQKETVYGERGTYDIPGESAVLTGKVRILQGDSWLEGTRATVDMRTGISKLFAGDNTETQGRVKGVFYPKKKEP